MTARTDSGEKKEDIDEDVGSISSNTSSNITKARNPVVDTSPIKRGKRMMPHRVRSKIAMIWKRNGSFSSTVPVVLNNNNDNDNLEKEEDERRTSDRIPVRTMSDPEPSPSSISPGKEDAISRLRASVRRNQKQREDMAALTRVRQNVEQATRMISRGRSDYAKDLRRRYRSRHVREQHQIRRTLSSEQQSRRRRSDNTNNTNVRAGEWVREVQEFLNTRRDGSMFIRGRSTQSAAAGSKSDLGKCSPERVIDKKQPSGADEDLISLGEDESEEEEQRWMRMRTENETATSTKDIVLKGHKGSVTCMARGGWLSDILASGSTDGTSRLWNPVSGESLCVLKHGVGVTALGVCRRTQSLVTGTQDGTVWSWDVETGERTVKMDKSHDGPVTCVCVDTGGVRNIFFKHATLTLQFTFSFP
jgi:WD40 repeat protein